VFGGEGLAKWQEREKDATVADPLFTELGRLSPDSSALALGFKQFEFAKITDIEKKLKTAKLLRPPHTYDEAPPRKHIVIDEGFEDTDVGQGPPGWVVFAGDRRDLVFVTEDVAATGKRSLRVNDQVANYEPHFYIDVERLEGLVSFAFDLRLGEGARPGFEMRDTDPQYTSGPSVAVGGDRNLYARGKHLLQLPLEKWVNIKVETVIGSGVYTVRVKPEGGEEQVFEGMTYSPNFKKLTWLGFVSDGIGSVWEVDNLRLTP
jgi:hypothetical protein